MILPLLLALLADSTLARGDSSCENTIGPVRAVAEVGSNPVVASRDVALPTTDAKVVRIEGAFGALRVEGAQSFHEVHAVGTMCTTRARFLQDLQVTVARRDSELVVVVHRPPKHSYVSERVAFGMALVVEVPNALPVVVDNMVGRLRVGGVAGLQADVASGSVTIDSVAGDVRLHHQVGPVDVQDIEGTVSLEDQGVGDIILEHVKGDVFVRNHRSGTIRVDDVKGAFVLGEHGQGSLEIHGVQGKVDVPR